MGDSARIIRADVYRWAERWQPPAEPVNVFLSPPFADYANRLDDLLGVVGQLQTRAAEGSVVVLQAEKDVPLVGLPQPANWDHRTYGRNLLLFWVKEE